MTSFKLRKRSIKKPQMNVVRLMNRQGQSLTRIFKKRYRITLEIFYSLKEAVFRNFETRYTELYKQ
jgi:hypothetical protein